MTKSVARTPTAVTAWRLLNRWRGVALTVAAVVATVWLALSNQLILYIHPRYVVFTVVMALLALVFVVASLVVRLPRDNDDAPGPRQRVVSSVAVAFAVLIAGAMVVVPPATLSSDTVTQRAINSTGAGADVKSLAAADVASAASFAKFTVRDWASLLRQTSELGFYEGKPVSVTGFVTADSEDPDNVFYVSRFVITCCAVDAQPVGIPVYAPGWKDSLSIDGWVSVTGEFTTNPSSASAEQLALVPETVAPVGEPAEPYLF